VQQVARWSIRRHRSPLLRLGSRNKIYIDMQIIILSFLLLEIMCVVSILCPIIIIIVWTFTAGTSASADLKRQQVRQCYTYVPTLLETLSKKRIPCIKLLNNRFIMWRKSSASDFSQWKYLFRCKYRYRFLRDISDVYIYML